MRRIVAIFTVIIFTASCASTTTINTVPSGAKLYMNGAYKGVTPYIHSDTKIVGATTHLQLKKKGCKDLDVILTRDEQFAVGPFIGGLFVLVPFLWIMSYDPMHQYELSCGDAQKSEDDDEEDMT